MMATEPLSTEFLRIIYKPESVTSGSTEPIADIVFVHGLNPRNRKGFAYSTWTHKNGNFWPGEQLPLCFPKARALLFSYNSRVGAEVSTSGIYQHAVNLLDRLHGRRDEQNVACGPIIFVAHSLGGLVVKQALVIANNNERYKSIRRDTSGLMFFSVPHQGGYGASLGDVAQKIVASLAGEARNDLVASLKENSYFQESQASQFKHQLEAYHIVTVYENRPTKLVKLWIFGKSKIIVDEKSAVLGLSGNREHVLTLDSDHSEICKFEGDDEKFDPIKRALGKLLSDSVQAARANNDAPRRVCMIPFPRNKRFIGRKEQLEDIHEQTLNHGYFRKVAIYGLGGIGKTQVALELAYQVQERRPQCSIFWMPAISETSFIQAAEEMIRVLGIPIEDEKKNQKLQALKSHLSHTSSGEWLLILDNADDRGLVYDSEIEQGFRLVDCLPHSPKGSILFTSRTRELALSLSGYSELVEIDQLSEGAGNELLRNLVKSGKLLGSDADRIELLHELTFLPLAIIQAAAYMRRNEVTVSKYCLIFRESKENALSLLSRGSKDPMRYSSSDEAAATCWFTSFNQIKEQDPLAAHYLSLMSCFEPREIHKSMLPEGENGESKIYALGTLLAYSLITQREDKEIFDLHRLVHIAAENWTSKTENYSEWLQEILIHMNQIFLSQDIYDDPRKMALYAPHVTQLLKTCSKNTLHKDLEERWDLCHTFAKWLVFEGRYQDGIQYYKQAEQWSSGFYGSESEEHLEYKHNLAHAYNSDKQTDKAIELLEQVVEIRSRTLREDHLSRLASQHVLANAYLNDGRLTKAIELLEQVVEIKSRILREDHADRLASQHALANAYLKDGRLTKAIELLEQVVEIRSRILREDHPDRLASQHVLANAYLQDSRLTKAIELLEQVVEIESKTLREDHANRLTSQHALANAYLDDGRLTKAIELLEQVVEIESRTLREDHSSRLASQHVLANAYLKDGRLTKAIELLEQVVEIESRTLREDHADRLASQHVLANAYLKDGRLTEAIELLEQVVEIKSKTLREDHSSRLASQHALATAYLKDGRLTKAIELLEQVVEIKSKTLREDHADRLASQHELASAYLKDGRLTKAIELLEQVVEIWSKTLREDHADRLASQHELATAYLNDGRLTKAIELLEQVVEIESKTLREDHADRLASQHKLASAYLKDGRLTKAIELLEQVVEIKSKTLREDHADRLASQHELASAYLNDGRLTKAIELLEQVVEIWSKTLREDHADRLASQHTLATAYLNDGRLTKAIELLEQVVEIESRTLREDHSSRLASQHVLANAYLKDGRLTKAIELLEQVVEIKSKTLREDHPDRLASQHALARAYIKKSYFSKAVPLLEHVISIYSGNLAADHANNPDLLDAQQFLAEARNEGLAK